jgi:hypothetical protein
MGDKLTGKEFLEKHFKSMQSLWGEPILMFDVPKTDVGFAVELILQMMAQTDIYYKIIISSNKTNWFIKLEMEGI